MPAADRKTLVEHFNDAISDGARFPDLLVFVREMAMRVDALEAEREEPPDPFSPAGGEPHSG